MTLQSPIKKIYVTQVFGVNPDAYARFGLKGHNGIDFRAFLPNGERCYEGGRSEVFAPHDGEVKECHFDPGYGNYVKIESATQGSVLAHFSSLPLLKLGQKIRQGDFIGFQGTTGNSSGIHLHWGWYPIPRNRSNGFNGYENQEGKYQLFKEQQEEPMPDKTDAEWRGQYWNGLMAIRKELGLQYEELANSDPKIDEIINAISKFKEDASKPKESEVLKDILQGTTRNGVKTTRIIEGVTVEENYKER